LISAELHTAYVHTCLIFYQQTVKQTSENQNVKLTTVAFIIKNLIYRSYLLDEIDPVRWKRTRSSDFITMMHTIMSLYPIIPQSLWLATWNWLLERLRNTRHGQKSRHEVRFFSDASEQIWIWLWTN